MGDVPPGSLLRLVADLAALDVVALVVEEEAAEAGRATWPPDAAEPSGAGVVTASAAVDEAVTMRLAGRPAVDADAGESARVVAALAGLIASDLGLRRARARAEQAAERTALLVDAGLALASEPRLDALLARIVEAARDVVGARYAALGVLDARRTGLAEFVTAGLDDAQRAAIGDLPRGRGLLGALIRDARPLRIDRIADDPRSSGFPPNHPPMTTFLGVPVALRGEVYGNLYLTDKRGGPFTDEDERVAMTLAAQAAVAVDNVRRWRREAAAEGVRRAVEAQEAERARVARDLHDEAGQVLTALAVHLRTLEDEVPPGPARERVADLRASVAEATATVRELAVRLRPSSLHDQGLADAVEEQAARVRAAGMPVETDLRGLDATLPAEVQTVLFRVVQEALTNAARHSAASAVSVVASAREGRLRVVVEDDGRGFDPGAPTGQLGLAGIRERVAMIGGDLRIESAPGQGTAVVVDVGLPV
ncbi:MAG: GAF domain-containing protein [Thermoleophilia bacterium]